MPDRDRGQAVLLAQRGQPARLGDLVGDVPLGFHVHRGHHALAGGVAAEVVGQVAPADDRQRVGHFASFISVNSRSASASPIRRTKIGCAPTGRSHARFGR